MERNIRNSGLSFHKKGNAILDTALLIVVLLVVGFVWILSYDAFDEIKTDIYNDVDLNESKEILDETHGRYPSVIDGLFALAFILLWGMVLVASFMLDSHPIFFIFSAIAIIFVIIAGIFLGNFYEEFFTDALVSDLPAKFPIINWILTNMLWIGLGVGVSIMMVLYGKSKI